MRSDPTVHDFWEDENGIDTEQIEFNLSLTPAQRLEQHERWVTAVRMMRGDVPARDNAILWMIERVRRAGVPFVVVGELAAAIHGCQYVTTRTELCVPMGPATAATIGEALRDLNPRPTRMAKSPRATSAAGGKLPELSGRSLRTDLGRIDFVADLAGVGDFARVREAALVREVGSLTYPVLNLDAVVAFNRAAGRGGDGLALRYLERLAVIRRRRGEGLSRFS